MTKPSETHSVKSLWARVPPDQAREAYNALRAADAARVEALEEAAEALSETSMPHQSSHNSICIGFSSWLLVGSKPADNHDEKPMQRELCGDCWGIVVSARHSAHVMHLASTSAKQSRATLARRHFWGRIWFCSCCVLFARVGFRYDCW